MKNLLTLLSLIMIFGCGKRDKPAPTTDAPPIDTPAVRPDTPYSFDLISIPTNEAIWYYHYQTAYLPFNPQVGPQMDTAYHFYVTTRATGVDTVIPLGTESMTYTIYTSDAHKLNKGLGVDEYYHDRRYIRYDSTSKELKCRRYIGTKMIDKEEALDIDAKKILRKTGYDFISDSIVIYQNTLPAIFELKKNEKVFYCAPGVGRRYGLHVGFGGRYIRSLDFRYRSDSLHFEFPYGIDY